jgi:hypothetical protein
MHDTHTGRDWALKWTPLQMRVRKDTRANNFSPLSIAHTHAHARTHTLSLSPPLSFSLCYTRLVLSNLKLFLVHAGSVHGGRPSDKPWRESTPKTLLRRRVGQWGVWFGRSPADSSREGGRAGERCTQREGQGGRGLELSGAGGGRSGLGWDFILAPWNLKHLPAGTCGSWTKEVTVSRVETGHR